VRVLTQNLFGRRADWPARRSVLVRGITELHPDVIAFQESIVNSEYDQIRDMLGDAFHIAHSQTRDHATLGDAFHIAHSQTRDHATPDGDVEEGQGISIASRYPIANVHELELHVSPRTADFACTTMIAEIAAPIGNLLFVHHLPSWKTNMEYEREEQTVLVARWVEERVAREPMHVILAGDFDADPQSSSVRFWCGRQSLRQTSVCYRDAWESAHPDAAGHTFAAGSALGKDRDWPFRRIDYVMVRCGEHSGPTLDIASCELAFDEPVGGAWASDHFGVLADLEVHDRGA
jgi:endonuclease/exonuclease/phosphatase family metal-dependent hydrolase